jgi:hypothetical protein
MSGGVPFLRKKYANCGARMTLMRYSERHILGVSMRKRLEEILKEQDTTTRNTISSAFTPISADPGDISVAVTIATSISTYPLTAESVIEDSTIPNPKSGLPCNWSDVLNSSSGS